MDNADAIQKNYDELFEGKFDRPVQQWPASPQSRSQIPLAASTPEETRCAMTVHGHAMALAMLRGYKRFENRPRLWAKGWYFLHVGGNPISPNLAKILLDTWPQAPDARELPRCCIVGMVRLGEGRAVDEPKEKSPWALGPVCHPIEEAIELSGVVTEFKGRQGPWDPWSVSPAGAAVLPEKITGGTRMSFAT